MITTIAFVAWGLGCYGVGMLIGYVIGRAKGYDKGRADYQAVVGGAYGYMTRDHTVHPYADEQTEKF